MIQRIQTLYLLIAIGLEAILAKVTVMKWTGDNGFSVSEKLMQQMSFTISKYVFSGGMILMGLIVALFLGAIWYYKNRKVQMTFVMIGIGLNFIFIGNFIYAAITNPSTTTKLNILGSPGLYIPILVNILAYIAYKAIKKDEELVKSLDRIR